MQTLGARLARIEAGSVAISCRLHGGLDQQNGFFHAGVLASIADSACGYAAMSVLPPDADVLSIEFKINLLKPADSPEVLATARVVQAGKTIVFCEAAVTDPTGERLFAKMTATMIARYEK